MSDAIALVGLKIDAREGCARWLFELLFPKSGKMATLRKWDAAAKIWIVEAARFDFACDRSYELVHEARAAGFTVAEYGAASEALRECKVLDDAIMPTYRHLYGRNFQQLETNAATLPGVSAAVAAEYLRQTVEGDF